MFKSYKPDPTPKEDKDKGNGKELAKEAPKGQKKFFKCHGYIHFQVDCLNRRVLTIREIENLDQMEVEEDKEELDTEGETSYLPSEEGAMLMIKKVLHAIEVPPEANQMEQIFHSRCKVAHKTCNLIINGGSCTNVAFTETISKLNLATIAHPRP